MNDDARITEKEILRDLRDCPQEEVVRFLLATIAAQTAEIERVLLRMDRADEKRRERPWYYRWFIGE